jgi:hypothetical protein
MNIERESLCAIGEWYRALFSLPSEYSTIKRQMPRATQEMRAVSAGMKKLKSVEGSIISISEDIVGNRFCRSKVLTV